MSFDEGWAFFTIVVSSMADVSVSEELDALRAIYCKSQEFQEQATSDGHSIVIRFDPASQLQIGECGIKFVLPPDYPLTCPINTSIFCDQMTTEERVSLQHEVEDQINALKGELMLLEVCGFVQDFLFQYADKVSKKEDKNCIVPLDDRIRCNCTAKGAHEMCSEGKKSSVPFDKLEDEKRHVTETNDLEKHITSIQQTGNSPSNDMVTSVLQLDHMRSKLNYVKCIKKWTDELGLKGKLIFCRKYIFIVLQGTSSDVKDYVVKNRTVNVDVDSKGRSCKERLLTSLCEISAKEHIKFPDFEVIEDIPSIDDLLPLFTSFSMKDIYQEYIAPVVMVYSKKSAKKR